MYNIKPSIESCNTCAYVYVTGGVGGEYTVTYIVYTHTRWRRMGIVADRVKAITIFVQPFQRYLYGIFYIVHMT